MRIAFSKYHALGNSFLVIEAGREKRSKSVLRRLAKVICDHRTGVGADGILYLSSSGKADRRIDVYNADGSWAEKSGNGLRIAGVHMARSSKRKKVFEFEIGGTIDSVEMQNKIGPAYVVKAGLGSPDFRATHVPVKSRKRYLIDSLTRFGSKTVKLTCLSIGNPHTVIPVNNLKFDWQKFGQYLEHHKMFPRATNVEFVKVVNRRKLRVADWERGAGATGSSGTGAAAAVCAMVMLGKADRSCEVVFETGSLFIHWDAESDQIELTGPVQHVMSGEFEFPSEARHIRRGGRR